MTDSTNLCEAIFEYVQDDANSPHEDTFDRMTKIIHWATNAAWDVAYAQGITDADNYDEQEKTRFQELANKNMI